MNVAAFSDLAPLSYFGEDVATHLCAVGWLGRELPFEMGPTTVEVYRRLGELLENPFQPFVAMGHHSCELCQYEGEASGSANLFVPANEFFLFVQN
jgi:hypothetical protein